MLFALLRKKPVLWMSRCQFRQLGPGVVGRRAILAKEILGDLVDAHVGALGREDRGHQQFQRRLEIERAGGVGVLFGQAPSDLGGVPF